MSMAPFKKISFLTLFLLLPTSVSAATVLLQATPTEVGVGDTMRITVLLTSPITTNAFSGTLVYPAATMEPLAVNDCSSIISIWITRPAVVNAETPIAFAGITPGGFSGTNGILFSALFRTKAVGVAKISLENIEVLRNDGIGGSEPTTSQSLTFSVGSISSGGYAEPIDENPPEPFTAHIGFDSQLFDGQSYLVFSTADKISGIDYYAVAESRIPSFLFSLFPLSWNKTESPYILSDQNRTNTVYIKAVDRAGNERLSVYPPRYLLTGYEETMLLAILIGVVLLWQRRWRRRFKKNV